MVAIGGQVGGCASECLRGLAADASREEDQTAHFERVPSRANGGGHRYDSEPESHRESHCHGGPRRRLILGGQEVRRR